MFSQRAKNPARPSARRARRGAAAVEFALCFMFVLMPLMSAVLEWGWYFYQEIRVLNAVREGTRIAVSNSMHSSRTSAAVNWVGMRLTELNLPNSFGVVSVSCPSATISVGSSSFDLMTVTTRVPFDGLIGLLPAGLNPPDNLVVNYSMRTPVCT